MTEKAAQGQKIFDLTEVYDERSGYGRRSTDRAPRQIVMIDGRGYERVNASGQNIHDLTDVVDDQSINLQMNDIFTKQATEIIEKVAREVIPEIAERIIKEEIEKIKKLYREPS